MPRSAVGKFAEVDMARNGKLETTLGDFIVALTDAAERQVHDDKMSYELVAYILSDLINSSTNRRAR
jgi:hypothetical protein